ncbi:expressed unknown protein [Seminavis robusta]|uniref:Uncharacterized protein n=1 Tax=Seminavis robusta TaxID=568900 RepID=A0A9N8EPV0_9STRA|nr:expressed unknown protein [Seminavis robusta]|eukprot:Sro1364_g266480.1 n/a (529) ;mRNA; f:20393-21979
MRPVIRIPALLTIVLALLSCSESSAFVQRGSSSCQKLQISRPHGSFISPPFATSNNDDQEDDPTLPPISLFNDNDSVIPWESIAMIGLPFVSAIFPFLLQEARSLPPNSAEQLQVVTALFVSNRAYLYANAAVIVALAAMRGSTFDSLKLGQRITDLTEELLYRPDLTLTAVQKDKNLMEDPSLQQEEPATKKPELIQSLASSGIQESLDQVSTDRQALLLPILVSGLLAVSVFLVPFWNLTPPTTALEAAADDNALADLLKSTLPYVTQVWNAGILTLFTKAELRRLQNELLNALPSSSSAAALEWGLAAGITGVAFFSPLWPAQNFVNMAIAIAVARAIQLDKFVAVVGALGLLTLYDASSVFLIPSAGALDTDSIIAAASTSTNVLAGSGIGDSAMGSVALQKLTSGTFQPGMLVTKIDDRFLGGSLGLGDAVFPSLLATLVRRFDNDQQTSDNSKRLSLSAVSLVGFLLGCTACEFVPSATGLPALVFIIPIMLGSVLTAAFANGEVDALWNYEPSAVVETEGS